MTLKPEQKQAVTSWVAAGDNLSAVQKKLADQFQISLTYRDVRFLVDDLNLELKDPAPKVDTSDVSKAQPAASTPAPGASANKKGFIEKAKEKLGLAKPDAGEGEMPEGEFDDLPEDGNVVVTLDKVNLNPGAIASGTVKFSDGVTGKWIVDQQGRPGFTEVSRPGYRPSPADSQAFMMELNRAVQERGL